MNENNMPSNELHDERRDAADGHHGQDDGRGERVTAVLGRGRSVIVIGRDLTIEKWIATLQEAIAKGRRAKAYGLELSAFLRMLRDLGS